MDLHGDRLLDILDGDAAMSDKTFWVNVYPGPAFQPRETRQECDQTAGGDRVACVKVEYTEGQFDEDEGANQL